jgi:hypothetical protein
MLGSVGGLCGVQGASMPYRVKPVEADHQVDEALLQQSRPASLPRGPSAYATVTRKLTCSQRPGSGQ